MTPSSSMPMKAAPAPPDVVVTDEALKALGLDRRNPLVVALVMVCERYEFDPLLNHVDIIKSSSGPQLYVTRDGYLFEGHRSGQLDGIVVDELREGDHGWAATVSVWRKDMSHPFTYSAGCGKAEPQARQGHGPEMAIARAERRALRRAFPINVPGLVDHDDGGPVVPDTAPSAVEQRPVDRSLTASGGTAGGRDTDPPSEPREGPHSSAMTSGVPAPVEPPADPAPTDNVGLMLRVRRAVNGVWPHLLEPDKERLQAALVAVATHTRAEGPTLAAFKLDTAETLALSRLLKELEAGRATAVDDPELDQVVVDWDTWHYRVTFAPDLAVMVTKDYDPDDPERPM